MGDERVIPIPIFVDVEDVMRTMKCKRATAYVHMRRAVGRKPGQRGLLRVPVYLWQRYVDHLYCAPDLSAPAPSGTQKASRPPLRVTHERKKPGRRSLCKVEGRDWKK